MSDIEMKLTEHVHEWEYRPISWLGCKNCPATLSCDETTSMLNEYTQLEAENDVLRNTISLLKNENERMMKLAHDYITAYEKLAFGEERGDETE